MTIITTTAVGTADGTDYRALLDEATRAWHHIGLPGEQKAANEMRQRGGLDVIGPEPEEAGQPAS